MSYHRVNRGPGSHLNMKILSNLYRNFHYKDRTLSRPYYHHNGTPYNCKGGLHIETGFRGPWSMTKLQDQKQHTKCILKMINSVDVLKCSINRNTIYSLPRFKVYIFPGWGAYSVRDVSRGLCYENGLTLIPEWITNYIYHKVWH